MDFKNSPIMFFLGGIVSLFVLSQSLFFLLKALKEGKRMGIDPLAMRKAAISSMIFSIAPSISILVGLLALSQALGLALPWLRLSVVGAVTYELPAATAAAAAFGIQGLSNISDPSIFTAIAWVMTIGIIPSLLIIPLFLKKINKGVSRLKQGDVVWGSIFMSALFIGLISAFLGMGVGGGLLSILTLLSSAIIMVGLGILIKKRNLKWLETYAIPISMLGAMGLSLLFSIVL